MFEPASEEPKGYITDVPYTSAYYNNLNPTLLSYISAINGYGARPVERPFTYCELGCGHGLSTNVLAGAYPQSQFWGVDFNADHIRSARELAAAGEMTNVEFIEASFEQLLDADLPPFDFITMHGVYAWVSEAMRGHIRKFVAAKLAPNGLLYMSYNAMPGWSTLTPLRNMMLAYTETLEGDSLHKARHGIAYLRYLNDNGAAYFKDNPTASAVLEQLEKSDINYVAHEYFNENFAPQYFADVAGALQDEGLEFAGSLPVQLNYRDLCLPTKMQKLFANVPNRNVLEIHKDFVRNERFRSDVYVRGGTPRRAPVASDFESLCFGSLLEASKIKTEVKVPAGTVRLQGEAFTPLIEALCSRVWRFGELCELGPLALFGADDIMVALQRLVLTGQVQPCPMTSSERQPLTGEFRLSSPVNRALLNYGLNQKAGPAGPVTLACEVTGAGLSIGFADSLVLDGIEQAGLEGAAKVAAKRLKASGRALQGQDGVSVSDEAEMGVLLEKMRDSLVATGGARLAQLGIIKPL